MLLKDPIQIALIVAVVATILILLLVMSFRRNKDNLLADNKDLQQQANQTTTELALAHQQLDQSQQRIAELKQEKDDQTLRNDELQQALQRSEKNNQALLSEQQKDREFNEERLAQFEESRKQLKLEFEKLASEILASTQKQFKDQSLEGLDSFLKPFRQQVTEFKTRVEDIHTKDITQRAELKTELKQLHELNRQISEEASNLTTALKGQKKTQGNWGELMLENVLDRSGLRAGTDYQREVSFNTEDGRRRPDVIVNLPDRKHLVIDAKVSLNAYTRYVNAEDDSDREIAIREHVKAVNDRMNELSAKNYFELPGIKSPEMVFMFVPIESAFVEAIKYDERLFQNAIEKRVLITTPTTLLTSLNIVRQLWRFEDQNKNTAKLAESASKVYNQLRLFLGSMDKLGSQLDTAQKTYKKARDQLETGRGNLVDRVAGFDKLGVSIKQEIPNNVDERAALQIVSSKTEGSSEE